MVKYHPSLRTINLRPFSTNDLQLPPTVNALLNELNYWKQHIASNKNLKLYCKSILQ